MDRYGQRVTVRIVDKLGMIVVRELTLSFVIVCMCGGANRWDQMCIVWIPLTCFRVDISRGGSVKLGLISAVCRYITDEATSGQADWKETSSARLIVMYRGGRGIGLRPKKYSMVFLIRKRQ